MISLCLIKYYDKKKIKEELSKIYKEFMYNIMVAVPFALIF